MKRAIFRASILIMAMAARSFAHESDGIPSIDVADFARRADFVFKGRVTNVAYRDSEPIPTLDENGQPVFDETGRPVFEDGSGLAHAFVTFAIERVFKGRAEGDQVTLRFLGGVQEEPVWTTDPATGEPFLSEEIFMVSDSPLFDVGDRDVLFVDGNGEKPCPLPGCSEGRFRLINRDRAHFESNQVYGDLGHEIVRFAQVTRGGHDEVRLGPPHRIPDVDVNTLGNSVVEHVEENPATAGDSPGDVPPPTPRTRGVQFLEQEFDDYLAEIIDRLSLDPVEHAVASADIRRPFTTPPLRDSTPPPLPREDDRPRPRPWLAKLPRAERLAILEAERREEEAFAANGGDPVVSR